MDYGRLGRKPLVSATIFVEGGGDTNVGRRACRRGFTDLLEKSGFQGRMPRIVALGGRDSVYEGFRAAHDRASGSDYVAMLVDSEDRVRNINEPWAHLERRDGWRRPDGADDNQVLLMTTCMETWIAADRDALKARFGRCLQENALPPVNNIESRSRQDVQDRLARATRNCPTPYSKGQVSFQILGKLNPDALEPRLPSFRRARRILRAELG